MSTILSHFPPRSNKIHVFSLIIVTFPSKPAGPWHYIKWLWKHMTDLSLSNHEFRPLSSTVHAKFTTSFPGSLFSASFGHWKKDPCCGWSHDYPESGWQKKSVGWEGWQSTLWVSNPLAVAKNYSLFWDSKLNLPMMNAT